MSKRVGLLGWPVAHSVSPPMHNAAFAALGLDWHYDLLPVPPDQFADEVARLIDAGYRGFNVTIPHKHAAFALPQIHAITPAAEAIGAVNTLIVQPDGLLTADNTDWQGFTKVTERLGVDLPHTHCLVLGTGGSAKGVIYALRQGGAQSVTQVSRTPDPNSGTLGYDMLADLPHDGYYIVNCTPVGMHPNTTQSPWPEDVPIPPQSTIHDLVYNPMPTRLVQTARTQNLRAVAGLDMLVWQGVFAFELWTGQEPPLDIMRDAAATALHGE